jgi:hypothetical protein
MARNDGLDCIRELLSLDERPRRVRRPRAPRIDVSSLPERAVDLLRFMGGSNPESAKMITPGVGGEWITKDGGMIRWDDASETISLLRRRRMLEKVGTSYRLTARGVAAAQAVWDDFHRRFPVRV